MSRNACVSFLVLFFLSVSSALAVQTSQSPSASAPEVNTSQTGGGRLPKEASPEVPTVPRILKFSGVLRDSEGKPRVGVLGVTFGVYERVDSPAPLWIETQNVKADEAGHYSVLLGSNTTEGMPLEFFASSDARWLGVQVQLDGEKEQPRTMLVSVPYALKAATADNLGGRPATDFALTAAAQRASGTSSAAQPETAAAINDGSTAGIPNFLAKFETATTVVNSSIFENGGQVGIGTASPFGALNIKADNGYGSDRAGQLILQGSTDPSLRLHIGIHTEDANPYADLGFLQEGVAWKNLALAKNGGRVGIGTANPLGSLAIAGDNIYGSDRASQFVMQGKTNPNLRLFMGLHTETFPAYADFGLVEEGVAWRDFVFGKNGGRLSLGTSNPLGSLTIAADNVYGSDRAGQFVMQSKSNPNLRLFMGLHTEASPGYADFGIVEEGVAWRNFVFGKNGGNVGIGTATPVAKLDVSQAAPSSGSFTVGNPPPSAIHGDVTATSGFISGVFGTTSSLDGFGVLGENLSSGTPTAQGAHGAGVRGITANSTTAGTGVWGDALQDDGDNVGVFGHSASKVGTGVQGLADAATGEAVGVYGESRSTAGVGVWGEVKSSTAASATAFPVGVYGRINSNVGAAGLFDTTSTGNILIGRAGLNATPVFRVDSTGRGFFNGNMQVGGADFAESVSVMDNRSEYQPGDVMAIDTTGNRRFTKVAIPYSTLVAGIYSTKPGVLATPHHINDQRPETEEVPLAMVGIVPCKVTSENGVINAGDLLVSSSVAGFAMKGTDRNRMTGAVIGKALETMHGKTDVIEVLVSLQ